MLSSNEMVMHSSGKMETLNEFVKSNSGGGGGGVGAWTVLASTDNQAFETNYNLPEEIENAFSSTDPVYTDIIIMIEDYRTLSDSRKLCISFVDTFAHFKEMFNVDSQGYAYAGNEISAQGNCVALWFRARGKDNGHHTYYVLTTDTTVKAYPIKVKFMVR